MTYRIVVIMLSCPAISCNVKEPRVLSGLGTTPRIEAGYGVSIAFLLYGIRLSDHAEDFALIISGNREPNPLLAAA
jgi:hypothetical protein